MIKRRFYKLEHGDRDAASDSSSSSSDFDIEPEETEDSEEEEEDEAEGEGEAQENANDARVGVRGKVELNSSSSGYESEESSAHEVNLDSSGFPTSDDDTVTQDAQPTIPVNGTSEGVDGSVNDGATVTMDGDLPSTIADCVVKHKSVFKCILCPRIVCLSEVTLQAHLKSKRHARSEKLLKEGRLKHLLNDDGRVDADASSDKQVPVEIGKKSTNKKRGGRRQKNRPKGGKGRHSRSNNARKSGKYADKKRRISGD